MGQVPKVSRDSAENVADMGPAEDRSEELDGYAVTSVTIRQDADLAPMLKGLPDDRCQCPHWGYVFSGTLTWRYADREEVCEAGDASTLGPAIHPRPRRAASSSRSARPRISWAVEAAITKNMQAMRGA